MSPSASLTYVCRRQDSEELVRNALRSRERESSEEKWVCYSEVVERKVKEEEVTSSVVDLWRGSEIQGLSLKLDYEEILNAWSDKGPLYIRVAESSQIVPDITHDILNSHEIVSNNVRFSGHFLISLIGFFFFFGLIYCHVCVLEHR